jgi:hypothetical protein
VDTCFSEVSLKDAYKMIITVGEFLDPDCVISYSSVSDECAGSERIHSNKKCRFECVGWLHTNQGLSLEMGRNLLAELLSELLLYFLSSSFFPNIKFANNK